MRIAVCDDEKETLDLLCGKIKQVFGGLCADISLTPFGNGSELLSEYESDPFDAVFLDIDMPSVSGFEAAEQINRQGSSLIVFVTSHDELVYSSFRFQPFRFLRKEYIESELPEAASALIKTINERASAKSFEIKTGEGEIFIDLSEVEYIEIYGHWLRITRKTGEPIECYGSLTDFEKRLEQYGFVRTHKSYLVNCRYIYSVEQRQVVLDDKTEIPLSRYKAEITREKLKNYLRSNI